MNAGLSDFVGGLAAIDMDSGRGHVLIVGADLPRCRQTVALSPAGDEPVGMRRVCGERPCVGRVLHFGRNISRGRASFAEHGIHERRSGMLPGCFDQFHGLKDGGARRDS